jgi:hypothetical protein
MHPNIEITLCGNGSTSQARFHVACHDVATNVSPLVTNIDHIGLSVFLTKQHHLARDAKFGYDWAKWFDHL